MMQLENTNNLLFIIIFIIICGIGAYILNYLAKKNLRKKIELEKKECIRFNKCIDLILEGKMGQAEEMYNTIGCVYVRRPFLNGLFIGLNLEENKDRLLKCKYIMK